MAHPKRTFQESEYASTVVVVKSVKTERPNPICLKEDDYDGYCAQAEAFFEHKYGEASWWILDENMKFLYSIHAGTCKSLYSLSPRRMSPSGIEALSQALTVQSPLRVLTLRDFEMTSSIVRPLMLAIQNPDTRLMELGFFRVNENMDLSDPLSDVWTDVFFGLGHPTVTLRAFYVRFCRLNHNATMALVRHLPSWHSIRHLTFTLLSFSEASLSALIDTLPSAQQLTTLVLGKTYFTVAQYMQLSKALNNTPKLHSLSLFNCVVNFEDVSPWAESLGRDQVLREQGDKAKGLMQLVHDNHTLTALDLSSNWHLTVDGLETALRNNRTLTTLKLNHLYFRQQPDAWERILCASSSVKHLSMQGCLDAQSEEKFVQALIRNTTLESLCISDNVLHQSDLWVKVIEQNRCLRHLDLGRSLHDKPRDGTPRVTLRICLALQFNTTLKMLDMEEGLFAIPWPYVAPEVYQDAARAIRGSALTRFIYTSAPQEQCITDAMAFRARKAFVERGDLRITSLIDDLAYLVAEYADITFAVFPDTDTLHREALP